MSETILKYTNPILESHIGFNLCEDPNVSLSIAIPSKWMSIIDNGSDIICVTNPFWLTFDPPSWTVLIIWFTFYILLMIVGCIGNFLVIYLFLSSQILRNPSNLFIVNLALSDFFLLFKIIIICYNIAISKPVTGRLGCDVYGFTGGLTGTCSIMTLAAIALDRYLVIAFPLDPFKKLTFRQASGIISCIWIYATLFSIIPLMGFEGITYSPEGFLTACSFDYLTENLRTQVFIWCFFIAAWVLPLVIITYSYVSILLIVKYQENLYVCNSKRKRTVWKSKNSQSSFSSKKYFQRNFRDPPLTSTHQWEHGRISIKHQKNPSKTSDQIKLAKIASIIVGLWVVAWTPYAVVALLGITGQRHLITPLTSMIPALFCKTAACIDPYIYALSHPKFKREIQKRIVFRCRRWRSSHPCKASQKRSKFTSNFDSVSSLIELDHLKELDHLPKGKRGETNKDTFYSKRRDSNYSISSSETNRKHSQKGETLGIPEDTILSLYRRSQRGDPCFFSDSEKKELKRTLSDRISVSTSEREEQNNKIKNPCKSLPNVFE